jgi:hypothetical protein
MFAFEILKLNKNDYKVIIILDVVSITERRNNSSLCRFLHSDMEYLAHFSKLDIYVIFIEFSIFTTNN